MNANDKYCLSWNNFESNLKESFKELKQEKEYLDVTVACENNFSLEAHKVVLSSCSTFFKDILRKHKHQHPLVYLKGVQQSELESVVNFMYLGETHVAQENLESFLAVAEELKVKGLIQNSNTSKVNSLDTSEMPNDSRPSDQGANC